MCIRFNWSFLGSVFHLFSSARLFLLSLLSIITIIITELPTCIQPVIFLRFDSSVAEDIYHHHGG